MPEYLAPGVFVEETSFRAKSIEGVSTTTTGFIGPTRFGPTDVEPDLVTSLVEFERIYGDGERLAFADGTRHNHVWHAVRAFFENGGKRLYVQRVFEGTSSSADVGRASWKSDENNPALAISARFPGYAGERRVRLPLERGPAALVSEPDPAHPGQLRSAVRGLAQDDIVWFRVGKAGADEAQDGLFRAIAHVDAGGRVTWKLRGADTEKKVADTAAAAAKAEADAEAAEADADNKEQAAHDAANDTHKQTAATKARADAAKARADATKAREDATKALTDAEEALVDIHAAITSSTATTADAPAPALHVVTATVTVFSQREDGASQVWSGLALEPGHRSYGAPDSLMHRFSRHPDSLADRRTLPVIVEMPATGTGLTLFEAIFKGKAELAGETDAEKIKKFGTDLLAALADTNSVPAARSLEVLLTGGDDGNRPTAGAYEGDASDPDDKYGLKAFEDLEDISIVAAPGATEDFDKPGWTPNAVTINDHVVRHAERMRYRIAVIDCGDGQGLPEVKAMRDAMDSKHAAFYYPWIRILDPVTKQPIHLPPSGFIAGIYARNDVERAVHKAPANEVVSLALGFERTLNKAQQEVLNPKGINCLRFFEGRGNRVWGARTISSDPEWKYLNLRRYFAYLERSIDVGTQWAVFEPNGPALWANVRRTIADFLFNEFTMGAFLGDKPEASYFVKCDRSTMTQNQIDNGQLVCLVGVAVVKPAEFVIFRVGQWTADAKR